jgi:hypothetical protein
MTIYVNLNTKEKTVNVRLAQLWVKSGALL